MTEETAGIRDEKPHLIPLDAFLAILFSMSLVLLTLSFEKLTRSNLIWETLCFLVPSLVILAARQSLATVFTPAAAPPRSAAAALSLLLSATILGLGISGIIDNYFDMTELETQVLKEITAHPFYERIFLFAAVPAICEELLFRGVILNSLRSLGKWASVLLTSALFAIFHGSVELLLPIFVVSLALSLIGWERGGLILAMACHFVHNLINLVLMSLVEGDIALPAAAGMAAGGLILFALSFYLFSKANQSVEEKV